MATGPIDDAVLSAKALAENKGNRQLHVAPVSLTNHSKSVELKDLRSSLGDMGENLQTDPTRLCLQAQCPAVLLEHLELHAARLSTYDLMRCKVEAYLVGKLSSSSTGLAPMDVDALQNGKRREHVTSVRSRVI